MPISRNQRNKGIESIPPRLRRWGVGAWGFLLEKGEECWAGRPLTVTTPVVHVGMGLEICFCIKPPGDPTVD